MILKIKKPLKIFKVSDKEFYIPDNFNTNILHHFFYYKITFVNLQHENTNSNGDVELINQF